MCLLLNISVINQDKRFCHKTFWGYMFICRNAEGIQAHLSKCLSGTCSPVGMLKGCMISERLGTPDLHQVTYFVNTFRNNLHDVHRHLSLLSARFNCLTLFHKSALFSNYIISVHDRFAGALVKG